MPVLKYLAKRCLQLPLAIIGLTLIVFLFMSISGDPATLLLPEDASEEDVQMMRKKLGVDRPLYEQYGKFLYNAVQGDFGTSFRMREPAFDVILRFYPATLQLAAAAIVIATLISIPLGTLAAVKRGSIIDTIATFVSVLGQAAPVFWVGMLAMLLFSMTLYWLPVAGRGSFAHIILPGGVLGWYMNAFMTRFVRSNMLEILNQNYIRTARAKGLPERTVIFRHAFKNAQVPLLTIFGLEAGALLTGTVVIETVFAWPGLGRAAIYAVNGRDYPVVMASVIMFGFTYIIINFLIDVAYHWIDPRIREEE